MTTPNPPRRREAKRRTPGRAPTIGRGPTRRPTKPPAGPDPSGGGRGRAAPQARARRGGPKRRNESGSAAESAAFGYGADRTKGPAAAVTELPSKPAAGNEPRSEPPAAGTQGRTRRRAAALGALRARADRSDHADRSEGDKAPGGNAGGQPPAKAGGRGAANRGDARAAGAGAGGASPWTPPPPPPRLIRREGQQGAVPIARRTGSGSRPNLPVPPVGAGPGYAPPAPKAPRRWGRSEPVGPTPPVAPEDRGPRRIVVNPDNDAAGRVVIDERAAEEQARQERRVRPPKDVRIIESFSGSRLMSHTGPLRRIRSSFVLLLVTAFMAVLFAGILAAVVGGIAVAISHASGS